MNGFYAATCAVLVIGGVWALIHGLHRTEVHTLAARTRRTPGEVWAHISRRPPGPRGRSRDRLLVIGLAVGLIGYLITGWFLVLLITPLALVGVPYLLGNPPNRDLEMLTALDRWIRGMSATLQTGQSITDAVRNSVRNVPGPLAAEVRLLVSRLDHRWSVRDGLQAMADSIDSADVDSVLAALSLAAQRGGTGAARTLDALSDAITDRIRALREIESERAKPRVVVRQVTVISLVVLGIAMMVGSEFFAPYRTGIGQLILIGLLSAYVLALVFMRRMTAPTVRQRILQGSGP